MHNDINNEPVVLYLSHGGGPLPILGDEGHAEMIETLQSIASRIKRPSAIVVISAHWEEKTPTVTSGARPEMIYDYFGFPEEAYTIQYPAPGEPGFAAEIVSLLKKNGISAIADSRRGFDHGMYIPLKIMYPEADIPCVQISLVRGLDPETHIRTGKILSSLKHENLLIIGSGMSFHNIRAFFHPATPEEIQHNRFFDEWLTETCSSVNISETSRSARLADWEKISFARYCHPREEHLLPLHVCYGIAGRPCTEVFNLMIMGRKISMYLWQDV